MNTFFLKKIRKTYSLKWLEESKKWKISSKNESYLVINMTEFILKFLSKRSIYEFLEYEKKKTKRNCKELLRLKSLVDFLFYQDKYNSIPEKYRKIFAKKEIEK